MGATVTTARLAAAFQSGSGATIYALFERTYSKNCYPHDPRWSCVGIGTLERTLKRIFEIAAECEGGMLQTRSGWIKPESYLRGWLLQLADPVELSDRQITLQCDASFSSAIPESALENACATLVSHGYAEVAQAIRAGSAETLGLHAAAGALCALFDGVNIPPWRLLGGATPLNAPLAPQLGYRPRPCRSFSLPSPSVLRVAAGDENRLMQDEDGSWRCEGWPYRIVGRYVASLWRAELAEPGSYARRIEAFRSIVEQAPPAPAGTRIVVDLEMPLASRYQEQQRAALTTRIKGVRKAGLYEFPVPTRPDLLYLATALPSSCTRWVVEATPVLDGAALIE